MARLLAAILSIVTCAALPCSPAWGQFGPCPTSCLSCSGYPTQCSTAASQSYVCTPYHGYGFFEGSYDLRLGQVQVHAAARPEGRGGGSADIYDDLVIVGPPGETIEVTACLDMSLTACDRMFTVAAQSVFEIEGAGSHSVYHDNYPWESPAGCASLDATLCLVVRRAPGEIFRLHAWYHVGSTTSISSSLSFTGLPPGVEVRSCQGFTTAPPTSARRPTWGALKVLYR